MIEGTPLNVLGGSVHEQGGVVHDLIQRLAKQAMEQPATHLSEATLKSRSLTKELMNERIRTMALSADQAIANAQAKRLLNKLGDKFNLISSMQRNLG